MTYTQIAALLVVILVVAGVAHNQYSIRQLNSWEDELKAKCYKAITPIVLEKARDTLIEDPAIHFAMEQPPIPACIEYVKALLNDPKHGGDVRWDIEQATMHNLENKATSAERQLTDFERRMDDRFVGAEKRLVSGCQQGKLNVNSLTEEVEHQKGDIIVINHRVARLETTLRKYGTGRSQGH